MAHALSPERRAWPRVAPTSASGMDRARLRPGRAARVVDVSSGGALIETDWRLLPGLRVELQLGDPVALFRVAARILRCHVSLVGRSQMRYRGAVAFEQCVPVGELATRA